MATTFSDIISLAMASKIINDIRWEQDFRENAALFLRQKSKALELAIPKFNRPPEIREYLEYTSPSFDSYYEYTEAAISGTGSVRYWSWSDSGSISAGGCSGSRVEAGADPDSFFGISAGLGVGAD